MGYRRVGWKLQNHDHILLHLVLEHERALWKETLLSRREKRRSVEDSEGGARGQVQEGGAGRGIGGRDRTDG